MYNVDWSTVRYNLSYSFIDIINYNWKLLVFVLFETNAEDDSVTPRVRNADRNGFEVFLEESSDSNTWHRELEKVGNNLGVHCP